MQPDPSSEIFDFFLPEFRQNPYAFYKRLRESDPVHWGISFEPGIAGMWHIARYSDILQILRDQRFTHQALFLSFAPVTAFRGSTRPHPPAHSSEPCFHSPHDREPSSMCGNDSFRPPPHSSAAWPP